MFSADDDDDFGDCVLSSVEEKMQGVRFMVIIHYWSTLLAKQEMEHKTTVNVCTTGNKKWHLTTRHLLVRSRRMESAAFDIRHLTASGHKRLRVLPSYSATIDSNNRCFSFEMPKSVNLRSLLLVTRKSAGFRSAWMVQPIVLRRQLWSCWQTISSLCKVESL